MTFLADLARPGYDLYSEVLLLLGVLARTFELRLYREHAAFGSLDAAGRPDPRTTRDAQPPGVAVRDPDLRPGSIDVVLNFTPFALLHL